MKLYYSPGACSLAAHIMLKELGINSDYESVDLKTHQTQKGEDYYKVNPKGYVPALIRDGGEMLTEATAVLYYLSEQKPSRKIDRIKLIESLTFLATEVHKNFGPLFSPNTPQETVKACKDKLAKRFEYLDKQLAGRDYLLGPEFSAADAYLFTMLNWSGKLNVDLSPHKNLNEFIKRIGPRPAVQAAMKEEGLAK
jgi:glutathione S-transferase